MSFDTLAYWKGVDGTEWKYVRIKLLNKFEQGCIIKKNENNFSKKKKKEKRKEKICTIPGSCIYQREHPLPKPYLEAPANCGWIT